MTGRAEVKEKGCRALQPGTKEILHKDLRPKIYGEIQKGDDGPLILQWY